MGLLQKCELHCGSFLSLAQNYIGISRRIQVASIYLSKSTKVQFNSKRAVNNIAVQELMLVEGQDIEISQTSHTCLALMVPTTVHFTMAYK